MKAVEVSKAWFIAFTSIIICCALIYLYVVNSLHSPTEHLEKGRGAIKLGNFEIAFEACKVGVQEIGDQYQTLDVIDDSGLKESAALFALRDGEIMVAANTMCNVLESRIQMLERQWR